MTSQVPISLIEHQRCLFHKKIIDAGLLTINNNIPSNSDKDNKTSVSIALSIATSLNAQEGQRMAAQTSGNKFEEIVADYISHSLPQLKSLRPGKWEVQQMSQKNRTAIAFYSQYEHLSDLRNFLEENPMITSALGNDYNITPDIIVSREKEQDETINQESFIVDSKYGTRADIRKTSGNLPLLHASVSAKWTLRSDRAQNARSEALNLIRNRKGRQPHILVVTGEPLPSRISSIALGTGDIDCVYHFALIELINAVNDLKQEETSALLDIMISGKRLKDISDLPLDLTV